MEKNYQIKEDQKNNITEPSYRRKSNSIDKMNSKNKLEYSKKLQRKHLINIHKMLSREKNSIRKFETTNFHYLLSIVQKRIIQ